MIIELHKFLIYGHREEIDRFFSLAQKAGFIEFIGSSHKRALELPDDAKLFLSAIKVAKRHWVHPEESPFAPLQLAQKVVSLNEQHEALLEEKRILRAEIARIAVFGDFSRTELDQLQQESKRLFQFYCMKSELARTAPLPADLIFVGTEYDLDYFVAVHKEPQHYPNMIEIHIERPVGQLRERLSHVTDALSIIERELRELSNDMLKLQNGLIDCLNTHHLHLAKHDADLSLGDTFFAIEAWVPKHRVKALHGLLSNLSVQCERIAIEEKDHIPTCIENKGTAKLGEDLVQIYDTPSPTDRDPSLWVLIFFAIFFAMIISDAGYGLLYLIAALVLKWKFPRIAGAGKRFLKLTLICSTCCILWGVATSSYFGLELGFTNPLRKVSLFRVLATKKAEYHLTQKDDVYQEYARSYPAIADAKNGSEFLTQAVKGETFEALDDFYDNLLMECAFLAGMLHISFSLLRYLTRNWASLGWVFFIIGGYLYFPSILNATTLANFLGLVSKPVAQAVGSQLTLGGIGLAFLIALFQKGWGAFHELLNVIQVFADILSYLRLYALALGGMVMAHTFNDTLGIDLGILASSLIILGGHLINITLSIMGGVIHGLRLNFLEWYHYSFEGGGRLFNPLRLNRKH